MIGSEVPPGDAAGRVETIEHGAVSWTMVERPGREELALLSERYGFHPLDLEDLVSKTERPKLDDRERYLFVVLHFPVLAGRPRRLLAGELHVFLGHDYLVVVHDGDLRQPVRLFDELREDSERRAAVMTSPGRVFYEIVIGLVEATRPWCDRLPGALEQLQGAIFAIADQEPVRDLALLRREVIQLRRMIRPDAGVIGLLPARQWIATPDLGVYWGNARDQVAWLSDYLDDVWDTLEALSHSYDQLATQRVNTVMRLLTAISTIMLPLAVISGIYGMNIKGLPFQESDWAFEATLGLMLAVAVGLLMIFRRRRWI